MPAPGASDGNASGAGREIGVVGEVVDQFAGAGSVDDDLLDAVVEAVEVDGAVARQAS